MRKIKVLAGMTAGLMLFGSAAFAVDGVLVDGDGLVPVTNQALNLGSVCPGADVVPDAHNVALAVNQQNSNTTNSYHDGSVISWSVDAPVYNQAGQGVVSSTVPASLTLPSTWNDSRGSKVSSPTYATVSLSVPDSAVEGAASAVVTYVASGIGNAPNAAGTLTRDQDLAINWNVLAADHDDCVDDEVVYTLSGFYAPVKGLDAVTIKGGSTLPLKFNLFDEDGNSIEDEADKIDISFTNCAGAEAGAVGETVATITVAGDREVRWDADAGQYIFNYKSPKGSGCKTVAISHDDADVVEFDGLTITLR